MEVSEDDQVFVSVNFGESVTEIDGTAYFPADVPFLLQSKFRWSRTGSIERCRKLKFGEESST